MTWTERTVTRDGVRLRCVERDGPGPAVVLLHGLAGHAGEWAAATADLAGRYRLVAVDQRGHGGSERRPGDMSRAAHVADTAAVVERLGLGPVFLVGQSLGGLTAMQTAAAHPELVRGLVMVEAGPGGRDTGGQRRIARWLDSWPVPFPSRDAAAEFFGGGPAGRGWADGLAERDGGWWPRFERDVVVAALAEHARRDFWDEWRSVRCPTLVVLARDGFLPPGDVERMPRERPEGVTAVSVPGTGHDLHLERPDALAALLAAFLGEG
ncbi:alpha/beta hydrolase [Streptomyces capparidis]